MCGGRADAFRMAESIAHEWGMFLRCRGWWPSAVRAGGFALLLGLHAVLAAAPAIPAPDVWAVSTRRLPGVCRPPERAGLDVERLAGGGCGRWARASVGDLLGGPAVPLVVFIHGNRYSAAEAKSEGVRLARLFAAVCPDVGPVRTMVFSWPSEQRGVLLRDVRAKYDRAPADGHYLAWLLGGLAPGRPVAIVGYSYGAIVGLEALRDLSASDGRGGAAAPWCERPGRTHLVFVVPAVRCDALAPRGPYRAALAGVDRLTLVANSTDPALRFFDCIDRTVRADALGVTGMPRHWLPIDVDYAAVDAAGAVGPRHPLPAYLDSRTVARRIATGAVADLGMPRDR